MKKAFFLKSVMLVLTLFVWHNAWTEVVTRVSVVKKDDVAEYYVKETGGVFFLWNLSCGG